MNQSNTQGLTPEQIKYVLTSVEANLSTCYVQSYTIKDGKLQLNSNK